MHPLRYSVSLFLISLAAATPTTIHQQCRGFLEPTPNSKYEAVLTVKSASHDVSVLMFKLDDVMNTNIDLIEFDYTNNFNDTDKSFFFCEKKFVEEGKCNELDRFTIKYNSDTEEPIISAAVPRNHIIKYPVNSRGVYCVLLHSDGGDNSDIQIETVQAFGKGSLKLYFEARFIIVAVLPISLIVTILSFFNVKSFTNKRAFDISLYIFNFSIFFYNLCKVVSLYSLSEFGLFGESLGAMIAEYFMFNMKFMVVGVLYSLLWGFSCGYLGILTSLTPNHVPFRWKVFFFLYIFGYTLNSYNLAAGFLAPISFTEFIGLAGLWYYLKKNSKETSLKIENVRDSRNYKLSRALSFFIPPFVISISVVASIFISINSVNVNSMIDNETERRKMFINIMKESLLDHKLLYMESCKEGIFTLLGFTYLLIWFNKSPELDSAEPFNPENDTTLDQQVSSELTPPSSEHKSQGEHTQSEQILKNTGDSELG